MYEGCDGERPGKWSQHYDTVRPMCDGGFSGTKVALCGEDLQPYSVSKRAAGVISIILFDAKWSLETINNGDEYYFFGAAAAHRSCVDRSCTHHAILPRRTYVAILKRYKGQHHKCCTYAPS